MLRNVVYSVGIFGLNVYTVHCVTGPLSLLSFAGREWSSGLYRLATFGVKTYNETATGDGKSVNCTVSKCPSTPAMNGHIMFPLGQVR